MEMTIAILLWLQVMVPYGEYTETEYDQMVVSNSTTISAVMGDPAAQTTIWNQYGYVVPTVVINFDDEIRVGVLQGNSIVGVRDETYSLVRSGKIPFKVDLAKRSPLGQQSRSIVYFFEH